MGSGSAVQRFDVVVVGGGAAGLMCAIEAGRRGRSVVVLERNEAIGKKILISGGGRCNFTNVYAGPDNFFSQNPDFCRSALAAYPPEQFIALVESHGIAYHEKKLGQLFCDGAAQQIVDMLRQEAVGAGTQIVTGCGVSAVSRGGVFELRTNLGDFQSETLVIATGGLSIPKIGATGFGYDIAEQFGLRRVTVRPGLVPLTFSGLAKAFCEELSGVSFEAVVSCRKVSFRENVLFTHRGVSGPAILQISNAWPPGKPITLDLIPKADMEQVLLAARAEPRELATVLCDFLPRRLAHAWCAAFARPGPMSHFSEREVLEIARKLHAWELQPAGTAGFSRAEVTLGGVDTNDLQSKTMEARAVPGLFFIGEVVDVTGWLGGYNFQWAWASGVAAGRTV